MSRVDGLRAIQQALREKREAEGLSARRVGDLIAKELDLECVTSQSLYMWERGQRRTPLDRLDAWARVLGSELTVALDAGQQEVASMDPELLALVLDGRNCFPEPVKQAARERVIAALGLPKSAAPRDS